MGKQGGSGGFRIMNIIISWWELRSQELLAENEEILWAQADNVCRTFEDRIEPGRWEKE